MASEVLLPLQRNFEMWLSVRLHHKGSMKRLKVRYLQQ